ncbi:hypothetical protein AAG906_021530 [Vitis piasezkii]
MFGSKRVLIRLIAAGTTEKGRRPRIAWYHEGRRTLPKARAGLEWRKSSRAWKDCLEGRRRQKSPKEVRAGLGWENQGGREAGRRQAKLEEEARRRKMPHARVRCSRRPENCAWPARGCSFGAGAFTKVGDLLQALLLDVLPKEEVFWRQSRVKWIKEGNCNSKFFHRMANGNFSESPLLKLVLLQLFQVSILLCLGI